MCLIEFRNLATKLRISLSFIAEYQDSNFSEIRNRVLILE